MPSKDDIFVLGYAENGKLYVRAELFVKDIELRALCEEFVPVSMVKDYITLDDFEDFFKQFVEFDVSYNVLVEMYVRTLTGYYEENTHIEKYVRNTLAGEFGDIAPELQYDTHFMKIRRNVRERMKTGHAAFLAMMRKDMMKSVHDYLMDDMHSSWRLSAPLVFQKYYLESLVAVNAPNYVAIL